MSQYQENAIVTGVEQLSSENFRITFRAPQIAADSRPGQFIMVRSSEGTDPLLRRPFSVHQIVGDSDVQIYFKVVGRGTELMSQFSVGQKVSLLGPLGRGFELKKNKHSCLVGGGLGIAPLLFLTKKIVEKNQTSEGITVILGGRTRDEVEPLEKDFINCGVNVLLTTDDGSYGDKGFVTDILVGQALDEKSIVYTCGPEAMMARVYGISREKGADCQVSVEREMACGMGACLGCCREKADGQYTHVCINGPVYNGEDLKW